MTIGRAHSPLRRAQEALEEAEGVEVAQNGLHLDRISLETEVGA